ncbi:MAG: polysaccharide deacetylase family protein [Kaistella sp.]
MILLTFNIINSKSDFVKNHRIEEQEIVKITEQNTSAILRILENHNILATFFVEISLVSKLTNLIKKISRSGHEISFYNDNSTLADIETAKKSTEEYLGKTIRGIRQKDIFHSVAELKNLEFNYISNIENANILFPFQRLKRSTEISQMNGLSIIPESISPYSQIPYNDFVFQMLPLTLYKNMVTETMRNEDFVLIYLDSRQFTDFDRFKFKIPFYRKYNSGKKMEDKLEEFVQWINNNENATSRMKDFVF